jgi:methionyl-tRNA formyltransferase
MLNVLIVIDNVIQYERIRTLVEKKAMQAVRFDFRHSAVKSAIWEHADFQRPDACLDVKAEVEQIVQNYQLVISVHCFQFFPSSLVNRVRCINIHPGYNPTNRGWYPQVFSIIHQLPIGATIHEMDDKLDHGPIICRQVVETFAWDTSFTIYNRVLQAEMDLLETHFESILMGSYTRILPESEGNMFRKKDFESLCEIDMDERGSFRDFYNRIRALTHGEYQNAWFIDPASGKKIYLSLNIRHD